MHKSFFFASYRKSPPTVLSIAFHSSFFSDSDDSDEDYKEKGEKGRNRRASDQIITRLNPDPLFLEREANYRKECFSLDILPWVEGLSARTSLQAENIEYLPVGINSAKFQFGDDAEPRSLQRFESLNEPDGKSVLFTGGPVWAMAWAPQPAVSKTQYLAVSTHASFAETRISEKTSSRGLIQLWSIEHEENQDISKCPKFMLGICHSYGKIWDLEWCPSGAWKESVSVGCLAAASSDGIVRLMRIECPKSDRKFVKHEPAKCLIPSVASQGQCLSLTWYRGPGHRFLAACFSSGLAAVWELGASSSLLTTSQGTLPVSSWMAHQSSATSISFSASETTQPRFIVTGGTDRTFRFWDLRDTCVPIQEVKRGMVTSISWLPGHTTAAVCHDDVFLQAHTQTLVSESGFNNTATQPIIGQNSCAWDQSVSGWLGGVAVCTAAGELVVHVLPDSNKTVDQNKASLRRRAYVYLTNRVASKSGSLTDKGHLKYIDLWDKDNPTDAEKVKMANVRYSELMEVEDLSDQPTCSVNRVDWNPNLGSHFLLASGSQTGLVRVHTLASLNTEAVKAGLRTT